MSCHFYLGRISESEFKINDYKCLLGKKIKVRVSFGVTGYTSFSVMPLI